MIEYFHHLHLYQPSVNFMTLNFYAKLKTTLRVNVLKVKVGVYYNICTHDKTTLYFLLQWTIG